MNPAAHHDIYECLRTLRFCKGDGGREDYRRQNPDVVITGDCAIVAVAYAIGVSYENAYWLLLSETQRKAIWKLRTSQENIGRFWWRIICQFIDELCHNRASSKLPKHRDPLGGVHTEAYRSVFEESGYRGSPVIQYQQHIGCICSFDWDFVVDGRELNGGSHVSAVRRGCVVGDIDITQDNFQITTVWLRKVER